MDRLATMRTFRSVAETGSFSASARLLGVSAPLVSRHVGDLEAHLGIRLFHRTTRHVALSEAGEAYYRDCVAVLEQLDAAEARATGQGEQPSGRLRLSVPMDFGRLFLGPVLREFLSLNPAVQLDVRYEDRTAHLVEEQLDVAVRVGHLADSSLVARRLGEACIACYASPDYLARHGEPEDLDALAAHRLLAYTLSRTPGQWVFEDDAGARAVSVEGGGALACNNGRVLAEAACLGLGIVRLPEFLVADFVRDGQLVEVLAHHRSRPLEISAVTQHRRFRPAKITAFIEFLAEDFARREDWLPAPAPGVS